MDELQAWLVLARAPGSHAAILDPLLKCLGSASTIVAASTTELGAAGADDAFIGFLARARQESFTQDLRWLEHPDHHLIHWQDLRYPALLRQLVDAPLALYVRGDPSSLS